MHPRYKLINLVGRHKHVRDAATEIYNYASGYPVFRDHTMIFHTNPTTIKLSLENVVNIKNFNQNTSPKIIINCFPATSYENLLSLNIYVSYQSRYLYENINLSVQGFAITDDYKQQLLEKYYLYNDIYSLTDSESVKMSRIKSYIENNTLTEVP